MRELSICDWFYIRQAYFVASIGSMEFYNKWMNEVLVAGI
jgi:hypothetical protein